VAWLPKERDGVRSAVLRDVLAIGDPRRPRARQQAYILRWGAERAQVVCGEPASVAAEARHQPTMVLPTHRSSLDAGARATTRARSTSPSSPGLDDWMELKAVS
jgi:hypothetical protein